MGASLPVEPREERPVGTAGLSGARFLPVERIAEAEAKLLTIDERWVEGDLEADSYARLKKKWTTEQAGAIAGLAELEREGTGVADRLAFVLDLFEDLPGIWTRASAEARDALVGSMWPAGVVFSDGSFRTTPRSKIIAALTLESHEMQDARPSEEASVLSGSPGRIRTYDPAVNSRMLYR